MFLMRKKVFLCLVLVNVTLVASYLYILGQNVAVEVDEDFQYSQNFSTSFSTDLLDENFDLCLLDPQRILEDSSKINLLMNHYSSNSSHEKDRLKVLFDFNDLMSFLEVETVLVEPFTIFCMISPLLRNQLLRRKFNPKKLHFSKRIWTFGILEEYLSVLEKVEAQEQIRSSGFSIDFIKETQREWMISSRAESEYKNLCCTHIIMRRSDYIIHLVVFYKRGNFLWHAAMRTDVTQTVPFTKELHFVETDSAFEHLDIVSLGLKDKSLSNISIPSNPQNFLFEIATSKFLECNETIVSSFRNSAQTADTNATEFFQKRAIVALMELKRLLNPLLIQFWIWSGTLLGWYRQCGIIPYTSDVDFAARASDVDDLEELSGLFAGNIHLLLKERMGLVEEALEFHLESHRLRVDVFFLYNEINGTWYSGHRPSQKYYFRYHHPNITLCSAELLGHKVLVPCNAEEVIATEYGPNWMTPVSSWNYEQSIHNRGPNIYWDKEVLDKVYAY